MTSPRPVCGEHLAVRSLGLLRAAVVAVSIEEGAMVYVGDDWAEDHDDVELVDDEGRRLARARLPEGLDGITRYDTLRKRGIGHQAALRQLGNRLVGILHGCLKTNTGYDENTAWTHLQPAS